MRVTKYIHSCLLVEDEGKAVLIDPGKYSWESGLFDIEQIERIDEIAITHVHADHYYPEFVKTVTAKFPEASVITNDRVSIQLAEDSINVPAGQPVSHIKTFTAAHPDLPWSGVTPENTGFHLFDELTHPGDTKELAECKEILALPIVAPWGSEADQISMALRLAPKAVIPIHDFHWSDWARKDGYEKGFKALTAKRIELINITSGETVEL